MSPSKHIIERSVDQSMLQKITGILLTVIAWCALFYALLPLGALLMGVTYLPDMALHNNITSIGAWRNMGQLLPWWALITALLVLVLYLWATIQIVRAKPAAPGEALPLVTTADIAAHYKREESEVRNLQTVRRAVIHYDKNALMQEIAVHGNAAFKATSKEAPIPVPHMALAPCSVEEIPVSYLKPESTFMTATSYASPRLAQLEQDQKEYRTGLAKLWANIESIEFLLENLRGPDSLAPSSDADLYAVLQSQHISLKAQVQDARAKLGQTRYLLEEYRFQSDQLAA